MARGGYRPNSGPKKGAKYKKRGEPPKKKKKSVIPDDIVEATKAENLDPLTYMLKVMNDVSADADRRDRMAGMAAPFCHSRKGAGAGKKEDQADRAAKAGAGRFAASKSPTLKAVK